MFVPIDQLEDYGGSKTPKTTVIEIINSIVVEVDNETSYLTVVQTRLQKAEIDVKKPAIMILKVEALCKNKV